MCLRYENRSNCLVLSIPQIFCTFVRCFTSAISTPDATPTSQHRVSSQNIVRGGFQGRPMPVDFLAPFAWERRQKEACGSGRRMQGTDEPMRLHLPLYIARGSKTQRRHQPVSTFTQPFLELIGGRGLCMAGNICIYKMRAARQTFPRLDRDTVK